MFNIFKWLQQKLNACIKLIVQARGHTTRYHKNELLF